MTSQTRRNKLGETAKRLGLRMPQVQLLLAQERFLERLVTVDQKHCMIWKGGSLLLRRYSAIQPPRYTTDLDFLVRGATVSDAVELLVTAATTNLEDEFTFLLSETTPMKRDTPYGGERLEIMWTFEGRPNSEALRVDVCAGDDVDSVEIKLNDLFLENSLTPTLSVDVYPPEFIFAEKLETVARFATGNTRLKDFIDLWSLSKLGLDKQLLAAAICPLFQETRH